MKVEVTSCTASLTKLRALTENLIDRDSSRIKDLVLFEHFLENSPIRICLWSVDEKLNIIHQKCICPVNKDHQALAQNFFEGSFKEDLLNHHQVFLSEDLQFKQAIIGNNDEVYAVTFKKNDSQISGAALEITSRIKILHLLIKILEENKDSNPELSQTINETIVNDNFSLLILKLLENGNA